MLHRPVRSTTALVASLALVLPQVTFAAPGDVMLMCEGGAAPPCTDPLLPMGAPFVEQADGTMQPLPVEDAQAWREAAAGAVDQARAARDAAAAAVELANATAAAAAESASASGTMMTDAQAAADAAAQALATAMANAEALAAGSPVEGGPQTPEEAAAAVDAATVAAQEADAALQSATQGVTDAQTAAQAATDAAAQAGQSLADAEAQLAQAEAALAQADQVVTAASEAEALAEAKAQAEAAAMAQAEAEAAAAQAEADAAAAAQAEAEAAAVAQAEADAAAAAQAEADAAATAQAAADQAAADAAAMAEAQAAADALAAEQAATDAAAAEQAQADSAAADQAAADAAAAEQAAADQAAADQAAADQAAADQAAADQAAADTAVADAGQDASASDAVAMDGTMMLCLDLSVPPCAEGEPVDGTPHAMGADGVIAPVAEPAASDAATNAEPAPDATAEATATADAAPALPEAEAIPAEVAEQLAAPAPENAATTLTTGTEAAEMSLIEVTVDDAANADAEAQLADLLAAEQARNAELAAQAADAQAALAEAQAAAEAAAVAEAAPELLAQVAPADLIDPTALQPEPASVEAAAATESEPDRNVITITNVVNEARSATQDFATTAAGETRAGGEREGLSDLEKVLLLGLGAVAVGAVLNNGNEVVENTGDRVIARNPVGDLVVYRDDNAILARPGDTVRTETFADGSTRTFVDRGDGTQVMTIRAADGRVLRRARVFSDGTQIELIDDLTPSQPVNVVNIIQEAPAPVVVSASDIETTRLRDLLIADPAYDAGRSFSLRQVREIEAVRNLVPAIDLDAITFASGSAAIPANELVSLVQMGRLIEEALARNPREVFLVEGHTDATGSDALNLTLSDRRAETVALALTTNFAIPPENLVVQGYGERYLKVDTQAAEAANRRATIRRITPLLQVAAAN